MAEPRLADTDKNMALCVCVPARNEAARLPTLLDALAAQSWSGCIPVAIAVNNTTDDSLAVLADARVRHEGRLALHVETVSLAADLAHAGSARRIAMEAGLRLLAASGDGVLVSTDADTRPPADWLNNIAMAFHLGADIVGGRIEIDTEEPLPMPVRRLRAAWDRYWTAVRAIEDAIDPLPWDPAPRHGDHTGASLAIGARLYRACGGVPLLPTGEDRALVMAAVSVGARLVHPANVYTYVSPRRSGRAEGGMADAMQDMFDLAETGERPRAPAFDHWRERATWRRRLRAGPDGQAQIVRLEPTLPLMPHDMVLELVP